MIRARAHVTAMGPYALADSANRLLSLAQNESAFPPSPKAVQAGQRAVSEGTLYPDPDWSDLRAAVAAVHGLDQANILCGAGSMELIGAMINAFAGPGDEVIGNAYGYLFAATACAQSQATYVTVPETDFTVSVDAMLTAVTRRTRIVFLCNPGNPTGTCVKHAHIMRIRCALPADVILAVDQAYGEFDTQDPAEIFGLVARGDTVVFRTFSKAYALAAARVGWCYAPPGIGAEMRKLLNPNNVSGVSQAMAAAAMRDQDHMRALVARTAAIREVFRDRLFAAGFRIPESHTNFVLIPFADGEAVARADRRLRDAGYLVRGMAGYGLAHCLRATIGAQDAMTAVADLLCEGGPDAT